MFRHPATRPFSGTDRFGNCLVSGAPLIGGLDWCFRFGFCSLLLVEGKLETSPNHH